VTALRVLILTPTALPNITGNAISAERWRRALSEQGATVKVLETKHMDVRDFINSLDSFRPHLVHAHHISRAGSLMLDPLVAERYSSLPLVFSLAGTDINDSQLRGTELAALEKICRRARFIISQNLDMSRRLEEILLMFKDRIVYVAKAFSWFGDDFFDLRSAAGCRADDVLYLMPAGVRPVKGNLECLLALKEAHAANSKIRAIFAGPAYRESLASAARRRALKLPNPSDEARGLLKIYSKARRLQDFSN
jgi:L-malate glycosyltransferase